MRERMFRACDSPSPSTLGNGLSQRVVKRMNGCVLQVPVGSLYAGEQQSHSGGSNLLSKKRCSLKTDADNEKRSLPMHKRQQTVGTREHYTSWHDSSELANQHQYLV